MKTTAYTECPTCHVRVIWPVTSDGIHLPPVNWGPDPTGIVPIQHTATGTWLARTPFLARDDPDPVFPEKRFSLHKCERN
jgi:hypothetical protein